MILILSNRVDNTENWTLFVCSPRLSRNAAIAVSFSQSFGLLLLCTILLFELNVGGFSETCVFTTANMCLNTFKYFLLLILNNVVVLV